ncbi:MAG: uracil-DNA glycosylase [Pseudomonadota bacterium]
MFSPEFDPEPDCSICPRLREFILHHRSANPDWHNAPVDTWVASAGEKTVRLLITGLAPGLQGANRTGRPFTGDYAGDLLYSTLLKFGFAGGEYDKTPDDGLFLKNCAITNAVRCVPPENKPVGAEINNCRPFLMRTIERFPNLAAIVTLGKISHDSVVRALGGKISQIPFGHNNAQDVGGYRIFSSYHCSRYNTNTGRLTESMFEDVFSAANEYCLK